MPHINYLKLKINLITRTESLSPQNLQAWHKILGTEHLTQELKDYALTFKYHEIIADLVNNRMPNHHLATMLDNLPVNLDR